MRNTPVVSATTVPSDTGSECSVRAASEPGANPAPPTASVEPEATRVTSSSSTGPRPSDFVGVAAGVVVDVVVVVSGATVRASVDSFWML